MYVYVVCKCIGFDLYRVKIIVKCFCYFEWMVMIIVGWVIFVFLKFFFKCIIFYFKIKEIMVGCLLVVVIDNGIGYVIRFICFLFNSK